MWIWDLYEEDRICFWYKGRKYNTYAVNFSGGIVKSIFTYARFRSQVFGFVSILNRFRELGFSKPIIERKTLEFFVDFSTEYSI